VTLAKFGPKKDVVVTLAEFGSKKEMVNHGRSLILAVNL
jgi:hypothetical protein